VGVPLIVPDEGFMLRPGGRLPEVMDHVYGVIPPVAAKANE
jgi:hypothetical protein